MRRKDYQVEVPMNYFHFQVTDEKLFQVKNDKKDHQRERGDRKENGKHVQVEIRSLTVSVRLDHAV